MDFGARQFFWRAGRKLYLWARKESRNDMATNGELRLQRLVVDQLDPSSRLVAFDVGARIGDWSRSLVEIASGRPGGYQIHAFEPAPESRRTLDGALGPSIRAGKVRVNAVALSDEPGKSLFYVPHLMAGTSTLHPESGTAYETVFEVEMTTADQYCRLNNVDYIDLFKVDTEGNDLKVIRGARDLLAKGQVGVLQFEYNHRWVYSRSFLDVYDLIQDTPYCIAKVCTDALEVYAEWHPELERFFETNYALIHERLVDRYQSRLLYIGHGNACQRIAGR